MDPLWTGVVSTIIGGVTVAVVVSRPVSRGLHKLVRDIPAGLSRIARFLLSIRLTTSTAQDRLRTLATLAEDRSDFDVEKAPELVRVALKAGFRWAIMRDPRPGYFSVCNFGRSDAFDVRVSESATLPAFTGAANWSSVPAHSSRGFLWQLPEAMQDDARLRPDYKGGLSAVALRIAWRDKGGNSYNVWVDALVQPRQMR